MVADEEAEAGAIKVYNETIAAAVTHGDNGTRELIAKILPTRSATSTGPKWTAS